MSIFDGPYTSLISPMVFSPHVGRGLRRTPSMGGYCSEIVHVFLFGDGFVDRGNYPLNSFHDGPYWLHSTSSNNYSFADTIKLRYGVSPVNYAVATSGLTSGSANVASTLLQLQQFGRSTPVSPGDAMCSLLIAWSGVSDWSKMSHDASLLQRFLSAESNLIQLSDGAIVDTLSHALSRTCLEVERIASSMGIPLAYVRLLGPIDPSITPALSHVDSHTRSFVSQRMREIDDELSQVCSSYVPTTRSWERALNDSKRYRVLANQSASADMLSQLKEYAPDANWICDLDSEHLSACNIPETVREEWDYSSYPFATNYHPAEWLHRELLARISFMLPLVSQFSHHPPPPPPPFGLIRAPPPPPQLSPKPNNDGLDSLPFIIGGIVGGLAAFLVMWFLLLRRFYQFMSRTERMRRPMRRRNDLVSEASKASGTVSDPTALSGPVHTQSDDPLYPSAPAPERVIELHPTEMQPSAPERPADRAKRREFHRAEEERAPPLRRVQTVELDMR